MKAKLSGLMLGVAFAAGAAGSALAGGDVIYNGLKDPLAAIPVPAPIPVPTYEPDYYIRFDVGAAWLSNGTLDERGSNMDLRDIGDVETIEFGSIGAGRYITPSIRAELAVDLFTLAQIDRGGEQDFVEIVAAPIGPSPVTFDVTRSETIKFEQDIGMLNFYYDFRNRTPFTPYIGAGIGVTYRQLTRTASEIATCVINCGLVVPNPLVQDPIEGSRKSWDFAASAMAGFSYQLTDSILWDTGYRYLWQNGGLSISMPTVAGATTDELGASVVEIKDVGQHQFRTGLRFDLN